MRLLMAPETRELGCRDRSSEVDAFGCGHVHALPLVEHGVQVCPGVGAGDLGVRSLRKAEGAEPEPARHEPPEVMLLRVQRVANVLERGPVAVRRAGVQGGGVEAPQQGAKAGGMLGHGSESVD